MSLATVDSGVGPAGPATQRVVVEVEQLTKTFGRSKVLDEVNLALAAGEVHSLIGQNGSGKSTLIKILSGIHTADHGTVRVDGVPLSMPVTPNQLRSASMTFVHQDLGLVPSLTAFENIRIGHYRAHGPTRRILWRQEREMAQATLDSLHAGIDADQRVSELRAGQRALVAIARALQSQAAEGGCIVFDEATQSLPRESIDEFNQTIRALARGGTAIMIVTHRLGEVTELADRVTVLRDGCVVTEGVVAKDLSEAALSHMVLGRKLETTATEIRQSEHRPSNTPALKATSLRGGRLRELALKLHKGEIVGVTGPTDSGHEELPYILAGALPGASGDLVVGERKFQLSRHDIADLSAVGVALIPEHRLEDGLAGELSALENLTLPRVASRGRVVLRRGWQLAEFDEAVRRFGVEPSEPHAPVVLYSGGNQQKLLLAKWMHGANTVLLAHEPTQAVDVGARAEILRALRTAADSGAAVLVSSVEANDLAFICDRVLVIRNGVLAAELRSNITATNIAEATYGRPPVSATSVEATDLT
jgi:ribose transport system ATP-binding protein